MILLKKLKALQARLHALQPLLKCSMHLPVIAFNFFLPTKISRQKFRQIYGNLKQAAGEM